MTQAQMAAELGTESMNVSRWERGRHRPNDIALIALAELVGRNVAWFYTDHSTDVAA